MRSGALDSGAAPLASYEMPGTVGPYPIGLNYTVRHGTELVAAHYFYVSHLRTIPLAGTVQGEAVELKGSDGSLFHLHFVGNGSNGKQPLTFENSVGLSGYLTLNSQTFPVHLSGGYSTANPGERFYRDVTSQPDEAFEAMVQATRRAILNGDRASAATHISYPLTVHLGQTLLTIHNVAQFQTEWPRIFTPNFVEKIRQGVPHEMFVRNGQAMLGNGELWFGEQGLTAINAPE